LRLSLPGFIPDGDLLRRLLRIGLPGGCDVLAIIGCQLAYLAIINSLGIAAAAAHGLGLQIEALAYLSGSAFQVAAATMTGQFLGAGQPERATAAIRTAGLCAVGVMSVAGFVFFLAGEPLAEFFTSTGDLPTARGAARYLRIVSVSMPALALLMILSGALRGAGDTLWLLAVTLGGMLLVRLPGACLLAWEDFTLPWTTFTVPSCGWGVTGAWCAMVADVYMRSALVFLRFWHGAWKRVVV
jgi:Na+-driven multidrug efflux pump